ncbi:MAG: hypothetical protein ACRES9_05985 [Gammaproteobacteria bacterium]
MVQTRKFKTRDWVKHKKDGRIGSITNFSNRSYNVRFIGAGRAESVSARQLTKCRKAPQALYLEGSLDKDLASTRSGVAALRTWLDSIEMDLAYKNIHCLEDIRILYPAFQGGKRPVFVHIGCHGDFDKKKKSLFIQLDPKRKRIYLDEMETVDTFKKAFAGLPLLFSACELGAHSDLMNKFCRQADLPTVAAYTVDADDYECLLFELMLYQGVYVKGWKFTTAVTKAKASLHVLGIGGRQGKGQSFVKTFPA